MKLLHLFCGLATCFAASIVWADSGPPNGASEATISPFNIKTIMSTPATTSSPRLTTLDVIGIGMTVEMFRQSETWAALQKHPKGSILPTDPGAYRVYRDEKKLTSNQRAADALEYGASHFVEAWPIPSLSIWSHCYDKEEPSILLSGKSTFDYFNDRINDLRMPAGMHYHRIAALGSFFRDEPENILERAFQFFDSNPDVPALLLFVSDGDQMRSMTGDMSRERYWEEGPHGPDSMTEAFVALLLTRRERVDAYLRPFAGTRATNLHAAGPAKPGFKPTKYLPQPWTAEQLDQFDHLPTIAVLHRPVRISYRKDKEGKATFEPKQQVGLMSPQQRQAAFQVGFDAALKDLPGGKPARVFYDAGGPANGGRIVPLSLAVHHALPDFDLFKPDEGYDISLRIGNTGASSPFVQWALATMAGFEKKDASLTVNLRQNEEAMITVVTPSTDTRQHPMGHPIDFNLAPQDGGPAIPVTPPAPVKTPAPAKSTPSVKQPHVSSIDESEIKKTVEPTPIGTALRSGETCPQTGMWRCDPPDNSGDTFHVYAGKTFPPVTRLFKQTALQKLRGEKIRGETIDTTWTLLS